MRFSQAHGSGSKAELKQAETDEQFYAAFNQCALSTTKQDDSSCDTLLYCLRSVAFLALGHAFKRIFYRTNQYVSDTYVDRSRIGKEQTR